MSSFEDKNFIAKKAVEDAAHKKDPLAGEEEILGAFKKKVNDKHAERFKHLNKLTDQVKKLYDQISVPDLECIETTQMNNVLKEHNQKDKALEDEQNEILNRRKFASNKIRLAGISQIEGGYHLYFLCWIIPLSFILIESIANAKLLTQASRDGLIGGALIAALISLVSVGISVLAGRAFRSIKGYVHTSSFRTIAATSILLIWLSFMIVSHVSIGWYRYALINFPAEASVYWFELLRTELFAQRDIWSWVLTIAGLTLAAKAFHIGTEWRKAVLLKRFRSAERNYEKMRLMRVALRKHTDSVLSKIKDMTINKDIKSVVRRSTDITSSFELKKIEILNVPKEMKTFINHTNNTLSEFIDIWRTNYQSQNPFVSFPTIPRINPSEYDLDVHPVTEWIGDIDTKSVRSNIQKVRDERMKQIVEAYEKASLDLSFVDPHRKETLLIEGPKEKK